MDTTKSPRRDLTGTRRDAFRTFGVAGVASVLGASAWAQGAPAVTGTPPNVLTNPPRQWGPDAPPTKYPDDDIIIIANDDFRSALLGITQIRRVWTGANWAEGPAWCSQGQYLVFSDVQASIQYRYIWETRQVSAFRNPSFNSNGNAFDFQGRQISTQDFFRRVVRWEHDGSMAVLADKFDGKRFNSPNDLVPHPDGSIWFTDPAYGANLSEGRPDVAGGPTNPDGVFNPAIGTQGLADPAIKRELPNGVYRIDPTGRVDLAIGEDQLKSPNGLCFSRDYKELYVCSTGRGPGDKHEGGPRTIFAFDINGNKATNGHQFIDMQVDGVKLGPDGVRVDTAGRIWCSAGGPLGYSGVLCYDAKAKLLGRFRLPENCANLTFGGPKRNFLFMTASQSIYAVQLQAQGAAPG